MGVKFNSLMKETKRVAFEYEGDTVNIAYRPGAVTPKMQMVASRMSTLGTEGDDSSFADVAETMGDFVGVIVALVAEWDVLDDDGKPLPVNRDWVSRMPMPFLSSMFAAAMGDLAPNAKSAGN